MKTVKEAQPVPEVRRADKLRIALADQAAEISDMARDLVPPRETDYHGELIQDVSALASRAQQLLTLAVAAERRQGASWSEVGEALGVTKQVVHSKYAADVAALDDALTEAWLRDDDPWLSRAPEAAVNPAAAAARLDTWVTEHVHPGTGLSGILGDHAVSESLKPMSITEHGNMVLAGVNLVMHLTKTEADPDRIDACQIGLARRKVELYQRMQANPPSLSDVDDIADRLAGARARLARLLEDTSTTGTDHQGRHKLAVTTDEP